MRAMRDRYITLDGIERAVSDMATADILFTLEDVERELAGDTEGVDGCRYEDDSSPECLRERLLIELVARGLGL